MHRNWNGRRFVHFCAGFEPWLYKLSKAIVSLLLVLLYFTKIKVFFFLYLQVLFVLNLFFPCFCLYVMVMISFDLYEKITLFSIHSILYPPKWGVLSVAQK